MLVIILYLDPLFSLLQSKNSILCDLVTAASMARKFIVYFDKFYPNIELDNERFIKLS